MKIHKKTKIGIPEIGLYVYFLLLLSKHSEFVAEILGL